MPDLSYASRRRLRLSLAVGLAIAMLVAAWQLLGVLLPFLVSGVAAYLVLPLVGLSM